MDHTTDAGLRVVEQLRGLCEAPVFDSLDKGQILLKVCVHATSASHSFDSLIICLGFICFCYCDFIIRGRRGLFKGEKYNMPAAGVRQALRYACGGTLARRVLWIFGYVGV